ncbi:MAG: ester cyclase [Cytophagales bacterium]|nr:ester cyclase [Armatimonadota bacterium]
MLTLSVTPFDITMPVHQFFEDVWNAEDAGDFARLQADIDELFLPEYHNHHPLLPDQGRGRGGVAFMITSFREAFPDLRFTLEDLFSGKDRVAARWQATGSHLGPFLGAPGTGRPFVITGTSVFRVGRGKIAETWDQWDRLAFFQKLGVAAAPVPFENPRYQFESSDYRRAA